jgi:hypothetical protein
MIVMRKSFFRQLTLLLLFSALSQFVIAQASRTWVSGVGDDVNPCSRTAPCKTFAGAISKTAAGGEINVLDAGGYGAVTITKSITIDGGGAMGSILSSLTNGIVINDPNAVVTLRRISINGTGTGINGIRIIAAKKVQVEDCYLSNYTQKGIDLGGTGATMLLLNNVTIHNAADAVVMNNPLGTAVMDNCTLQSFTNTGINIMAGQAVVTNSNIGDCQLAVSAGANAGIYLSNNIISNNNTALQGPGKITSAANNTIIANKTNGATATVVKLQ